jgi:hypothetical protein
LRCFSGTLLLKALLLEATCAFCEERKEYKKFGFAPIGEGLMMAKREKIIFPRECGRKDCSE